MTEASFSAKRIQGKLWHGFGCPLSTRRRKVRTAIKVFFCWSANTVGVFKHSCFSQCGGVLLSADCIIARRNGYYGIYVLQYLLGDAPFMGRGTENVDLMHCTYRLHCAIKFRDMSRIWSLKVLFWLLWDKSSNLRCRRRENTSSNGSRIYCLFL